VKKWNGTVEKNKRHIKRFSFAREKDKFLAHIFILEQAKGLVTIYLCK